MGKRSSANAALRQPGKTQQVGTLTTEAARKLRACEEILRSELSTFVDVGQAFETIQVDDLYFPKYLTFQGYCRCEWALHRFTVYLKIETSKVFRDMKGRMCAAGLPTKDLPKNEGQIRPLLVLRNADTQWDVWQEAIKRRQERKCLLIAALVKEAVNAARADQQAGIREYIHADTTYPGIPYRLHLVEPSPEQGFMDLVCDLDELEQHYAVWRPDNIPASPPLVLVCPEYDLFADIQDQDLAKRLLKVFRRIPIYRFLIWTSGETWASRDVFTLPGNVEWVLRVWPERMGKASVQSVPFTRQLIDVLTPEKIEELAYATKVRTLLANILTTNQPIHMTQLISDLLGTDIAGKPDIEPVVITEEKGSRPNAVSKYDEKTRKRINDIYDLNKRRE